MTLKRKKRIFFIQWKAKCYFKILHILEEIACLNPIKRLDIVVKCYQTDRFYYQHYSCTGVSGRLATMSSDDRIISLLIAIQKNIYRFGGPILMVLGSTSCVLSLMVFTKKNLRQNPCSSYLMAFNTSSLFLIFTSILFTTLAVGYNIDLSSNNLSFCRFLSYTMFLFDILSPSYLILASVDRVLVTSPSALIRRYSTRRLAFICIILVTLFWALFHIHLLILINFVQFPSGFVICYFQPGIHTVFIGYYSLVIKGILIPILMLSFGLWTVKNVRRVTQVPCVSFLPTSGTVTIRNARVHRSKDAQLIRILLIDIIVYIIFNLMIAIVLLYQQFNPQQLVNPLEIQIQSLLLQISIFTTYIPFCIGCYTNILASKTFRNEIKGIFLAR